MIFIIWHLHQNILYYWFSYMTSEHENLMQQRNNTIPINLPIFTETTIFTFSYFHDNLTLWSLSLGHYKKMVILSNIQHLTDNKDSKFKKMIVSGENFLHCIVVHWNCNTKAKVVAGFQIIDEFWWELLW